jgi:hypothetical protein
VHQDKNQDGTTIVGQADRDLLGVLVVEEAWTAAHRLNAYTELSAHHIGWNVLGVTVAE